jgi:hypothetical protein
MSNGRKIYQMSTKYRYQHLLLQDPPKFTQMGGGVWFEKKPSGNPVLLFCWHIKQTKNKKNKIPIGKGTEDHIGQGS